MIWAPMNITEGAGYRGAFTIGANVNNYANNVFNGLIDRIRWMSLLD